VDRLEALRVRREVEANERELLEKRRVAIVVPDADALAPMRQLGHDLAAARGSLNVGLVVTVTPTRPIGIQAKKDGTPVDQVPPGQALEVEANSEVDIDIGDVATVRIRDGRRYAQETVESLEARWRREVAPHLDTANVKDLEGLSTKITEAHGLHTNIEAKNGELHSLQVQIEALADSGQSLREALERNSACRAALGDVTYETLTADIAALGAERRDKLCERRQQAHFHGTAPAPVTEERHQLIGCDDGGELAFCEVVPLLAPAETVADDKIVPPALLERGDQVGADEAGAAGDDDHRRLVA
jgi:hypothetical protein